MSSDAPSDLTVRFESMEPGVVRCWLDGTISERSSFAPLLQRDETTLILELSGIKRVNSFGVRQWMQLLKELRANAKALTFERCSVAMVQQLNMVAGASGGATVRSVLVPYVCESCDHETTTELVLGAAGVLAESIPCPECGAAMLFDDLPEAYLAFARAS